MYYMDPLGTRVELQVDTFEAVDPATGEQLGSIDWDKAIEFLQSEGFAANPVGVDYDPDEVIAAYRSGKLTRDGLFRRPPPGANEEKIIKGFAVLETGMKILDAVPSFVRASLMGPSAPNEGQFVMKDSTLVGGRVSEDTVAGAEVKAMPIKFAHFVLRSKQVSTLSVWYRTVLHTESMFSKNHLTNFQTYDDEHHRLACIFQPGLKPRPRNSAGVSHVTFYYESLQQLAHTYDRLRKLDGSFPSSEPQWVHAATHPVRILPFACRRGGPLTSLFYHDPDGNVVELCHRDLTIDRETLLAYYDSLKSFPAGDDFNVDELMKFTIPASKL